MKNPLNVFLSLFKLSSRRADTFHVTKRVLRNHWSLAVQHETERAASMVNPIKTIKSRCTAWQNGPLPLRNKADWTSYDLEIASEQKAFIRIIEDQITSRAPKSLAAIVECASRFPLAAKLFPSIPGISYSSHDLSAFIVRLFASSRTTDHLDTAMSFAKRLSLRASERHPNAGRWNNDQIEMFDSFVYRSYHLFHRKLRCDEGCYGDFPLNEPPSSSSLPTQTATDAGTFSTFIAVALDFFSKTK